MSEERQSAVSSLSKKTMLQARLELLRMCSMLHLASLFHTNQRVSGLGYYSTEEAIDFKYGT